MTITLTLEEVQAYQQKVEEHIARVTQYYRTRHLELMSIFAKHIMGDEDSRKSAAEEYKNLPPFLLLEEPPKLIPAV